MLDHKWAAWEKKENVMAYEIVCESESKRYRSDCASVLTKTCEILKILLLSFRLSEAVQKT